MARTTHTPLLAAGRAVLTLLLSAVLVASVAGCASATTYPTYRTYRFCVCQKDSTQWTAGEQRSLTWLAQESNTTADPAPQPVTLTLEAHGPFATVTPLPQIIQVQAAPLLLSSTITTSDHESHNQTMAVQVPSTAQPGDYVVMQTSITGGSTSWMEYHVITITQ